MSAGAGYQPPPRDDRSVGEMVIDVSERISILVREEIELAKAEVTEKITKLLRGGAVGIAAGIFVLMGLAMFMHAFAWLLDDIFFGDNIWIGFAIESLFWFIVAGIAGLIAYRSVQAGAPPVPELAIEEARRTKETLTGEGPVTAQEPTTEQRTTGGQS
ncbi:MAG TPA: phage holin family protein [Acidimicrobiia bacterium]|nr:phage holin family protein [Acidimicrobiia bacterium]